jgi:hypothetical protein
MSAREAGACTYPASADFQLHSPIRTTFQQTLLKIPPPPPMKDGTTCRVLYLLNTSAIRIEFFCGDPSNYAILSHVWGKDEVTFQEVMTDPQPCWKDGICWQGLCWMALGLYYIDERSGLYGGEGLIWTYFGLL